MLIMDPTSYGSPIIHGDENKIYVGKYCSIANSVVFDGGIGHNHKAVTSYPMWRLGYCAEVQDGKCKGDIHIGNDVWIGDGALIMSGVTIGDGAVIGARSVVTRNVGAYEVVVGVPAVLKKWRFSHPIIQKLLSVRWWDWTEQKIRENSSLLLSENIEEFIKIHERTA